MINPFPTEPEHPLFPLPTFEEAQRIVGLQGEGALLHILSVRRRLIQQCAEDPLKYLPPTKAWRLARRLLRRYSPKVLVMLGGNRSGKSFFCAYEIVKAMITEPNGSDARFIIGSETENSSIETAQSLIWMFLPPSLKALNGRRDPRRTFAISHDAKNGFADRSLVLPNGAKCKFVTYNGDPTEYEGFEFGPKNRRTAAWWMDENLPLPWLTMLRRRGKYRPGYGLWSFTPIRGITPTIKETVGTGQILRTKRAHILPSDVVLVDGLRPGRVPLVQCGSEANTKVVYFHSDMSPFGSGGVPYSESVAKDCEGKPRDYTLRIFYGFCRDVIGLQFPRFNRQVHVIRESQLPADGTNYLFVDPAGDRNWFLVYVRVAPGNPRRAYIWRDWPDRRTYGEWAVPTERKLTADTRRGWDGDPGPAQATFGWGVTRYKRLMRELETIPMDLNTDGTWRVADPMAQRLLNEAMAKAGIRRNGVWTPDDVAQFRARTREPVLMPIRLRKIDPRAGANPQAAEKGGTNIIEMFLAEQRDERKGEVFPSMELIPAYSGRGLDDGFSHVNELLDFDDQQAVCPVLNEPKLYVTERCEQVIWMFENYTGMGGEDGACKDPADLVRYLAQDDELIHVTPNMFKARKGVSY